MSSMQCNVLKKKEIIKELLKRSDLDSDQKILAISILLSIQEIRIDSFDRPGVFSPLPVQA
jgi:hypothetical protein